MTLLIITIIISLFLAVNMGASGFSISFTPSYGCGIIKRRTAVLLYSIFVLLGAVALGSRVVDTLTLKLVKNFDSSISGIFILLSASITMFSANMLKIPQSTSFVMVGAFTGAGIYYKSANFFKVGEIFVVAIIFSFFAFIITYYLMKIFYPPKNSNIKLLEKVTNYNGKLKKFIVVTDIYSAFAVGTNNVANVVAPILISGLKLKTSLLLLLVSPFFGIGGLIFGKGVINTISKEIVPLGEISASVISFVTSTFVIFASIFGLPTPYVQFTTFAVLGVSAIKDGIRLTSNKFVVKKILLVWLLVPIATVLLSFLIHKIYFNLF